jgi:ribonuclease P protein component
MGAVPGPPAPASPVSGVNGPSSLTGTPLDRRASGGEGLPSGERLLRRADYLRCYRTGRRRQGALVVLYFSPNDLERCRLGITASRKVGNSVVRHRLKRRVKEIYRRWPGRVALGSIDVVAHLKTEAGSAGFGEIERDLLGLLGGLRSGRGAPGSRSRADADARGKGRDQSREPGAARGQRQADGGL